MKKLVHFLFAFASLFCFGIVAHAQRYGDDFMIVRTLPKSSQMVKYYRPTQAYYGNGYVICYGYTTTTPAAAGYTTTDSHIRSSSILYLPAPNSGCAAT